MHFSKTGSKIKKGMLPTSSRTINKMFYKYKKSLPPLPMLLLSTRIQESKSRGTCVNPDPFLLPAKTFNLSFRGLNICSGLNCSSAEITTLHICRNYDQVWLLESSWPVMVEVGNSNQSK